MNTVSTTYRVSVAEICRMKRTGATLEQVQIRVLQDAGLYVAAFFEGTPEEEAQVRRIIRRVNNIYKGY